MSGPSRPTRGRPSTSRRRRGLTSKLQNTIHWVKSIAIDREAGGGADLAVGHYKPINSDRFVNDCHEFIFHFTPTGRTAARPHGHRRSLPGRLERDSLACRRQQRPLPRQYLVHPLPDDPEPRQGPAAPGHFPSARSRGLLPTPRRHSASRWRWTPSSASAAAPSPRLNWALISSGSKWILITSQKLSRGSALRSRERQLQLQTSNGS